MNQTGILLETGTNELETLELYIDEADGQGWRSSSRFGINLA